ncbi:hypothetical protein [Fimbriimonas ginsengisoli]|uniref:Tetratricopeptide repeat domain protein n=1 Tax=Fimbriimonas ginsengisoli Gsoil 348 TaxID=661478 RepID=A0A068NKR1_FIMGI|nr:hypothetical protein [Fimbriimonas ginsengisoli]AIE84168.1 tetratricopeptide repeat domain protein [Fimbriimonas ginsengisoli Gsoil 348]
MKRLVLGVGLWAVGIGCAMAAPAQDRLNSIWYYANERIDQQTDVWFDDGDFPASIQLLRVAHQLRPKDYEVVTNLGWMLENVQEWNNAEAVYHTYALENESDPDGSLPIAEFYFRRKKYETIASLLEPKISLQKHPHPNVYRILAHTYEKTGHLPDAERVWKQYIALAPKDLTAVQNLKRVEKKINQR